MSVSTICGLGHNVPIVTFLFTLSASCRALEGKSTIGRVFQKHFWLGPPLVLGGQITTFVPKTGVKWYILAFKWMKLPFNPY